MEGAVLAGKLAAEIIVDVALGEPGAGLKPVQAEVLERAAVASPREAPGVCGDEPIAFGGGQQCQ